MEKVLCIKHNILPYGIFGDEKDLEILKNALYIDREKAEIDTSYKQIIPYTVLTYNNKIFRYRRTHKGKEKRLRGLYSIGVGGHVNEQDGLPCHIAIEKARSREIKEEFIVSPLYYKFLGFINDDTNDVGKVHLGVAYLCTLKKPDVIPVEKDYYDDYSWVYLSELIQDIESYESWSQIVIKFLSNNVRLD